MRKLSSSTSDVMCAAGLVLAALTFVGVVILFLV